MLGKSLQLCCSSHKRPSPRPSKPASSATSSSSSSSSSAASSSSSSRASNGNNPVVFKNFNSLYDPTSDADIPTASTSQTTFTTTLFSSSPSTTPDHDLSLSTAIASRRFFPAAPGRSNSIVDSAVVSVGGAGAGLAVPTYSPDPYWDFRHSMEEMVAALGLDLTAHRAHLHELLLCYLALNRKHAHKYIVGAFADILAAAAAV